MYKLISMVLLIVSLSAQSMASSLLFQDDFETKTTGSIYSTTEFVGQKWEVVNGALSTGSSTLPLDVHYQHYVEIRYTSDQLLTNVSVSFDYLNTRSYGGRLALVVGQINEFGEAIWMNDTKYINWDVPMETMAFSRSYITPTSTFTITEEQVAAQAQGRSVNTIFLRELDITNVKGTGLLDNIYVFGNEIPPVPEPSTATLFGLGLLFLAKISRQCFIKEYDYEMHKR